MSAPDLDRYYTPSHVARSIVELSGVTRGGRCVDPACGDGHLLRAAQEVMPGVHCLGMDVDRQAIYRLRLKHPAWTLSHADALSERSWSRALAGIRSFGADLALLNPPFSMVARKGVTLSVGAFSGRCSVAMAHLLTAVERAKPRTCCAVVPESLVFSEMDASARAFLFGAYELKHQRGLRNSTFRGTRANAVVLTLSRRTCPRAIAPGSAGEPPETLEVIRGGLPVFEAKASDKGIPFLHSTDIEAISRGGGVSTLRTVHPIARGQASGYVLLLPRVGAPRVEAFVLTRLDQRTQLSDCVIALAFTSQRSGVSWRRNILANWNSLLELYRGTGARYVTVSRLERWLAALEQGSDMKEQKEPA